MSESVVAFNLDKLEIGDGNSDIYMFPIPANNIALEELLDESSFSLNGKSWDEGSSKVSIAGSDSMPSEWSVTVGGEAISEEELQDVVLLIPYSGELSW